MKKNNLQWGLYIIPALLVYTVFMAFPLLDSLRLSLFTGNTPQTRSFVGFGNFVRLFTDKTISVRYWGAFKNTGLFAIHMVVQNGLGILLRFY